MQAWGLDSDTKELTVDSSGKGGSEPFKQGGCRKDNFGARGGRKRGIIIELKVVETQQVVHQSS